MSSYPVKAKVGKSTPTPRDEVHKPVVKIGLKPGSSEKKQPKFTVCPMLQKKLLPIPFLTAPECLAIAQGKLCINPNKDGLPSYGLCIIGKIPKKEER